MTICIAAICDNGYIIGASDRMITSGDIQFQPSQQKTRQLTSCIVAMTAGDTAFLSEVLTRLKSEIDDHIAVAPDDWLQVRYVADRFVIHWTEIRREKAETALLRPLGLTIDDFVDRQATMEPKLVSDLTNGILQFAVPNTCCIIAGIDHSGPHLFHIDNGALTQRDFVGFAEAGTGGRHAALQLMLAQYSPSVSVPEALLLVYSAKRRAEVATGVGQYTDYWLIGPGLGSFTFIGDEVMEALRTHYQRITEDERRALDTAKQGIAVFIQRLIEREEPSSQQEIEA